MMATDYVADVTDAMFMIPKDNSSVISCTFTVANFYMRFKRKSFTITAFLGVFYV